MNLKRIVYVIALALCVWVAISFFQLVAVQSSISQSRVDSAKLEAEISHRRTMRHFDAMEKALSN